MKNRNWRQQRRLIRAGKRRRRKLRRSRMSLRVVESEAAEEEQVPSPITDRPVPYIIGIAERKQKRRHELQKKI